MKLTLIWFGVITVALIVAGCVILWIHRRWRAEEKAHARQHWKNLRQQAEDRHRLAWDNRRLIGFDMEATAAAS